MSYLTSDSADAESRLAVTSSRPASLSLSLSLSPPPAPSPASFTLGVMERKRHFLS